MNLRPWAHYQVVALIACFVFIQCIVLLLTPLNLSGDEAYYWHWSRRLDFSYYEKGPGIAALICVGRWLFGDTEFGVRFGALLCQFLISVLIYFFTAREYSRSYAMLIVLTYWSTLLFGSLGLFMTGDPPLCLFWTIGLIAAVLAVERDDARLWIPSFLAIGVGSLFKYTILILVPTLVLFLLFTPSRRRQLRSPGFLLGCLLLFACLTPVLHWNREHGWINFAENAGHLAASRHPKGLKHFWELVLGQWALVGPLLFPIVVLGFIGGIRSWRQGDLAAGLYVMSSLPLVLLCSGISFFRPVYANWPMPAFLGALLLFIHSMKNGTLQIRSDHLRRALLVNIALLVVCHLLFTGYNFGIPPKLLPTKKLVGWQPLGNLVEASLSSDNAEKYEHERRCTCAPRAAFIISEKYVTASEIGFYAASHPPVFVADPDEPSVTQFDVWSGWEKFKGKDALLVFTDPDESKEFEKAFCEIMPARIPLTHRVYGASDLDKFYLYRACDFSGFNFSALKNGRENDD